MTTARRGGEWRTAPPALLVEYGDASDSEQFEFLYAYSWYQKVTDGVAYPAVMLTSGGRTK